MHRFSFLHVQDSRPSFKPRSMFAEAMAVPPPAKETFHFINDPADVINEALTLHNPWLSYVPTHKIIYRSDLADFRDSHVTTIGFSCGGQ